MAAVKYFDPQGFLQFAHLHAQGGLCNETGLGGFGKMPVCIDGKNIFQLGKGHQYQFNLSGIEFNQLFQSNNSRKFGM
jgi:hypothetical protein